METFGTFVREWRGKRGLSLGQLSLRSGLNKATLSRWENDRSLPRIPELIRVLDALEAPPSARASSLRLLDAPRAILAERRHTHAPMRLSLGDLLYSLRQRSGKTQAEAAAAAGVSRSQIAHWENDANQPSGSQLHAVGFVLGASAEEIVTLTTGTFAQTRLARNREALLHTYMSTLAWEEGQTHEAHRLHLLSLLANFGHLLRADKADSSDLALIFTAFGDCAEEWDADEERREAFHGRALALTAKSWEPPHFHLIVAIQGQLSASSSRLPLKERIAAAYAWLPRFRDNAGQAYLLSFIARAIASADPDEAMRLMDRSCALVAENADEYPCRLRDRGNILRRCGRPAEALAFIADLKAQDTFREGLKQLDMATCLIDLDSRGEARQCVEEGRRILTGFGYSTIQTSIADLERAVA